MEHYVDYHRQKKGGFQLDPRTKILFMAFVTTMMFFVYEDIVLVTVFAGIPFLLLVLNRQRKIALIYGGLFVLAIIAVYIKNMVSLPQVLNSVLILLIGMVLRLFPTFMLGYYIIQSTKANEFITAMKRWHVSEKFIIPVTVVFRFIPTIQEESRFIRDAMRMREIFGAKKFLKNPGAFMEYRLIPLMISIAKIGEELSAAALTRGLGGPVKRTNIAVIGFGFFDALIFVISIVLLICTFI